MSKFYLFGYDEYDTHNGGMGHYRYAFDTLDEAKSAILTGGFSYSCFDIAWVNPVDDQLEYDSYWKDQRWMTADGHWTDVGFENNPVRWVNAETHENVEDGQILRSSLTYDELVKAHENDPGKETNPLPMPEDNVGMRGTYHEDTGLFYCIDNRKYYKVRPDA